MDDIDNGGDVSFADPECPECQNPTGCRHHHYRKDHFMASKKRKGGNKKKRGY